MIRDIYSAGHFPPPLGGGIFLSILKKREEFEGGFEKRKGKWGKRRKKKREKEKREKEKRKKGKR